MPEAGTKIEGEEQIVLDLDGEGEEADTTPEYSEAEQDAIAHGWNPEGVEGKRNLTAEEFMDRKPLYDDLHAQQRKIKRLEEGIEALKQHNKVIAAKEKEKLVAELKEAKRQALEEQDFDAVINLDDQIAETRNAKDTNEEINNEAFNNWVEENPWYSQDTDMKEYADLIGTAYYNKNPTKTPEQVYAYVTKETRARFADKFPNERKPQVASVESASRGRVGKSKSKYSARDLPEEHLHIMKSLIRSKLMTEDEYLKDYFS